MEGSNLQLSHSIGCDPMLLACLVPHIKHDSSVTEMDVHGREQLRLSHSIKLRLRYRNMSPYLISKRSSSVARMDVHGREQLRQGR
ncbi:hypothetical protein AVEN_90096-1 [Araneus ventricosus]|uniref:Uncharacterized protein n=1 Tax=Araneus ventricosus TaxID=182803 RepID=A0A4Y2V7U5_ARAVE|nr:hypothetical protein AVEN_90096-1 [Araneus ventricosus]